MNEFVKWFLRKFSSLDINMKEDYKIVRKLQELTAPSVKMIYDKLDMEIISSDLSYVIPVRVFHSSKEEKGALIFFHGGGWVIGDIDSYIPTCTNLAEETGYTVIAVEYRKAPEHTFPKGFEDCYHVTQKILGDELLAEIENDKIFLIGDSAGGNLAAAVSLKLRNEGKEIPRKQILIYPSTYWDHSETSIYESIRTNGYDYGLTSKRIEEYMDMYIPNIELRKSVYASPLMAEDFSNQPETLIITAEFDPLRDEGEAYGKALLEGGNSVKIARIENAVHGFFTLPLISKTVREAYDEIKKFLS